MAIRRASPVDTPQPPSPSRVFSPSGRCSITALSPAASTARRICCSVASGRPRRMLSRTVASSSTVCCPTQAHPPSAKPARGRGLPPDLSGRRLTQTGDQRQQRALSGTGGSGDRGPGARCELGVGADGVVVGAAVAEADCRQRHADRPVGVALTRSASATAAPTTTPSGGRRLRAGHLDAITGASGAGKSTLLWLIGGLRRRRPDRSGGRPRP